MKKSLLLLGIVFVVSSLTSCTTDDLSQNINDTNVRFEEEMNSSVYEIEADTVFVQPNYGTTQAKEGDPIVKTKNG